MGKLPWKLLLKTDLLAEEVPELQIARIFHFSAVKRRFSLSSADPIQREDSGKDGSLIWPKASIHMYLYCPENLLLNMKP